MEKRAVLYIALSLVAVAALAAAPQLVITEAVPNSELGIITIVGVNFGSEPPEVILGGSPVTVQSATDTEVVTDLPSLPSGSYLLEVSRGNGAVDNDEIYLTLGAPGVPDVGDVTGVTAGTGLTGGGTSGDLELSVDIPFLDGQYARLDQPNSFELGQTAPSFTADTFDGGFVFADSVTSVNPAGTGVYGETAEEAAPGVAGVSNAPGFGIGVSGSVDSDHGYGLYGFSFVPAGDVRGLFAEVFSPEGTAGYFVNGANGTILSGHRENEELVFRVTGDGTVEANAFTDLAGNPIGSDGVGVFQVDTGAGLAGGPITDSGLIEVDFGHLDSIYPGIDRENFWGAKQFFGDVAAQAVDASSLHVQNDQPTSFVIDGLSLATSGQTRAVNGTTLSPDSIAVAGQVAAPGPGFGTGVLGMTDSDSGVGTYGVASSTAGDAVGVYGETFGSGTTAVRGVVRTASGIGGVGVSGSSDGDDGIGLLGTSDHPNGTAGVLRGQGGALLRGETNGGEVLRVDGDGTLRATAVVETSARRFKTAIRPLEGALDAVSRLRGVAYQRRSDGRADVGLIAEEVAAVVPEVVAHGADGRALGVNYGRLTALLVEAVKEQGAMIDALRAEIAGLEARLGAE